MLSVTLFDSTKSIFLDVASVMTAPPQFSTGEHGMERCEVPVSVSANDAAHFFALAGTPQLTIAAADLAWKGRVEDVTINNDRVSLVAYGNWSILDDEQSYTALWSSTAYDDWEEMTEENVSTVTDTFHAQNRDRLYIAPRKGGTIADGDRGGVYLKIPDGSSRNLSVIQFSYEVWGSSKWKASLRRWASSSFGTPTDVWTPTLTTYGQYTGAYYGTFTGSPLVSFEFESEVDSTTLGTVINGVSTTLAPSSLRVNTTSGTAVAAPGTVTITPASMTNIANGTKLLYGASTVNLEKVTASAVTGTTFNATFKNTHLVGTAIKSIDDWAVPEVDTTTTAGYAAGAGTVITPASMANIVSGMVLIVGWGGEAEEEVTVTAATSTTFTATLVYGHASGEKVKNGLNSYSVRPQSMTGILAGMRLDIGGRNSETVIVASVTATHFTAPFQYGHPGDSTVTTSKLQTVTPASMTDIVVGRTYRIGNEAGVTDSDVENVEILEVTGSTFTAEFKLPHGSTDTVVRIYSGDYNAWLKITDLRIGTTSTNVVNTTIGSKITAGTRTVTPAAMTNIYVGQKLVIDGSGVGDLGEIVEVTAITSTTFTAVFAINHTTAITVKAFLCYADEIVESAISSANTDNVQISGATALVESPALDLTDIRYEDQSVMDVLVDLAGRGDNQTPPRIWSVGVWDNVVHFRPRGTDSRTWYLDASTLQLNRSLQSIVTEVIAAHKSDSGALMRTAAATDSATEDAWGVKRRLVVDVNTTNDTLAGVTRDAVLDTQSGFIPAATITFTDIYTDTGARLTDTYLVRADDYLVIRNIPAPIPSVNFRIKRTEHGADGLRLELEGQTETIESLVSLALRPAAVNGARKPFVVSPIKRKK